MAYQTRSTRTEALLLAELGEAGLRVEIVDPAEQHPDFRVCMVGCCWVGVGCLCRAFCLFGFSLGFRSSACFARPTRQID